MLGVTVPGFAAWPPDSPIPGPSIDSKWSTEPIPQPAAAAEPSQMNESLVVPEEDASDDEQAPDNIYGMLVCVCALAERPSVHGRGLLEETQAGR